MPGRLEGKVALVTGATRGIGRGIAQIFAREGAKVLLAGRSADAGKQVESDIQAGGGQAVFVQTDIGREDDVVRATNTAVQRFGKLTTLVNNAAATHLVGSPERGDTMLSDLRNEILAETIQTNIWGLVWCCKYAIPEMLKAGEGSIVNISSGVATRGAPFMDAYTVTKGSMNALTRSLAVEYAPKKIRVNCISTGFIETGQRTDEHLALPGQRRYLEKIIPLPFFGKPEDIAWGAVYLASDEARYVTGANLPIDGGALSVPS